MPKIELGYWDDEFDRWVTGLSDREYDAYTVQGVTIPESSRYDRALPAVIDLYVDEETGVVVHDIPKYERSLKS